MKGIIQGYGNAIFKDNQSIETEAKRRLAICERCPRMKITLGIKRCGSCGCPLSALTRQNKKICSNWK